LARPSHDYYTVHNDNQQLTSTATQRPLFQHNAHLVSQQSNTPKLTCANGADFIFWLKVEVVLFLDIRKYVQQK